MDPTVELDWGQVSEKFDELASFVAGRDLSLANEAQTRYDVIDRVIREVLGWAHGQVQVEEDTQDSNLGYVDYILRGGDYTIIVEAKKVGAAFPSPTKKRQLKLNGSVLSKKAIRLAIEQAEAYARAKQADIVVVTNGLCWCLFSSQVPSGDRFAWLLFPFSNDGDPEQLFDLLASSSIEKGSLDTISQKPVVEPRTLLDTFRSEARVDRNQIADYIFPAITNALHADALLNNLESLEKCFISTDLRIRYDSQLQVHLSDPKPKFVAPAERIKRGKKQASLSRLVNQSTSSYAPPVTLIIGPVGVGKSTFLRHFEQISGRELLLSKKAHWVYIDFAPMGRAKSPREFIYENLRDYINSLHPDNPTDYSSVIEPAYRAEIEALTVGPLAPIRNQQAELNRRIAEYISNDLQKVEPFVDKVFKHLSNECLCIVVLDNVDLFEDEQLETSVFAEGLALSKRIHSNVLVSIRDTTFARHMSDATFDAYELRKMWLDAPVFRAVVSKRLTYAKKVLHGQPGTIVVQDKTVRIPDMSVFFDIVQASVLEGNAGLFVESIADLNIRRGLTLITNFLTSGHIEAEQALNSYFAEGGYTFPFHEIFRGAMLGQWKHFRETKSECVNLFDARFGLQRVQLLRLYLLGYLVFCARKPATKEVQVSQIIDLFSKAGASSQQVCNCLNFMWKRGLVKSLSSDMVGPSTVVSITRSGAYYMQVLSHTFVYAEEALFDTTLPDQHVWQALSNLTQRIENEPKRVARVSLRRDRIKVFLDYLVNAERAFLEPMGNTKYLECMGEIRSSVMKDAHHAVSNAQKYYG